MWHPFRKEENGNAIVTPKCNEHERLIAKVARIEGENFVIIAMLTAILLLVLSNIKP